MIMCWPRPSRLVRVCWRAPNSTWSGFAVQTAEGQAIALTLLEAHLDREQAAGCTITRHSKDVINKFAIVAGLWQEIITHLLPSSLLPRAAVNALDEKFLQGVMLKGSLFEEVWHMVESRLFLTKETQRRWSPGRNRENPLSQA